MAGRLENKVILITGAGGGLGSEQVRMMAKEGAKIVAANLKQDPIIADGQPADALWNKTLNLVEEIKQDGGKRVLLLSM
ncbi:SDR family NAD(P)-dependent oxidoreductase [Methylophaga sulfidovorans]|uniref:Short chain dehydrogenase n=1 Tax=Methylophaga sulfidovorans TaxID=45496 RepID=A0A1I3V304_9GAMM|nr:SDR family NAD(P)-dependent oxidoreductase [Methylophaga sulfidovorans]SFJ89369.1 short chain dehydrogenase [Methylophaga sulfidovorans]